MENNLLLGIYNVKLFDIICHVIYLNFINLQSYDMKIIESRSIDTLEHFNNIPFLGLLSEEEKKDLLKDSSLLNFEAGERVFNDGDSGTSMFVVIKGELLISKQQFTLTRRGPGHFFGEMSLLESKPRSATVTVLKDSILLEIDQDEFEKHVAKNSQALLYMLKNLSGRSRGDLNALAIGFEQLKAQERISLRLQRILNDTSNEIYLIDSTTFNIIESNSIGLENLGYAETELVSLNLMKLVKDLTREQFEALVSPLRLGTQSSINFGGFHIRKDGSVYPVETRLQIIDSEHYPVFVAIVENLTERHQMEEKLNSVSYYDSLTGLPNRSLVEDRLEVKMNQANRHKSMLAIILLDLDNFNKINESLGHSAGDLLLQQIAQRLTACLRAEDTVARMGGDEFIILAMVQDENDVLIVVNKIMARLHPSHKIYSHEIFAHYSVGITIYPNDGSDTKTLMRNVDAAMFQAKESGKNNFKLYTPKMLAQATRQMTLESGLRKALDRQEFVLAYQPKVDIHNGKLVGMEALIRWKHPEKGFISPGEFIPVAEQTRLIIPIGEWVLSTVCAQLKTWVSMGLAPLSVSVNLSGHQLGQKFLVDRIKEILTLTQISPEYLELEVTETVLMERPDAAVSMLNQLNDLGIQSSIDDFGTGYSSLSYLKILPIKTLKIDQSFVRDIDKPDNEANGLITKAIVSLAKALSLKTVAEGVETENEKAVLKNIGADIMQGYLFSKPLLVEEITELIIKHQNKSND